MDSTSSTATQTGKSIIEFRKPDGNWVIYKGLKIISNLATVSVPVSIFLMTNKMIKEIPCCKELSFYGRIAVSTPVLLPVFYWLYNNGQSPFRSCALKTDENRYFQETYKPSLDFFVAREKKLIGYLSNSVDGVNLHMNDLFQGKISLEFQEIFDIFIKLAPEISDDIDNKKPISYSISAVITTWALLQEVKEKNEAAKVNIKEIIKCIIEIQLAAGSERLSKDYDLFIVELSVLLNTPDVVKKFVQEQPEREFTLEKVLSTKTEGFYFMTSDGIGLRYRKGQADDGKIQLTFPVMGQVVDDLTVEQLRSFIKATDHDESEVKLSMLIGPAIAAVP